MRSIVNKVKTIEAEAQARLAQVEQARQQQLTQLISGEPAFIQEVRHRAQKRAKEIMQEFHTKAASEVNVLRQAEHQSTQAVKEAARRNQARVVEWLVAELTKQIKTGLHESI